MFVVLFYLYPLLWESDGGAIFWTNRHPLRNCSFRVFHLFLWLLTT